MNRYPIIKTQMPNYYNWWKNDKLKKGLGSCRFIVWQIFGGPTSNITE